MVVRLNHLLRLDIYGLSRRTLVMYYTANLPFVCRSNGQHESSFAQSRCRIFVNQSVGLCLTENTVDSARHSSFRLAQFLPQTCKFRRRIIAQFAVAVEQTVEFGRHRRERQREHVAHTCQQTVARRV